MSSHFSRKFGWVVCFDLDEVLKRKGCRYVVLKNTFEKFELERILRIDISKKRHLTLTQPPITSIDVFLT